MKRKKKHAIQPKFNAQLYGDLTRNQNKRKKVKYLGHFITGNSACIENEEGKAAVLMTWYIVPESLWQRRQVNNGGRKAGIVVQQVDLLLAVLASPSRVPVWVLTAWLPKQLPSDLPGKAAADGLLYSGHCLLHGRI